MFLPNHLKVTIQERWHLKSVHTKLYFSRVTVGIWLHLFHWLNFPVLKNKKMLSFVFSFCVLKHVYCVLNEIQMDSGVKDQQCLPGNWSKKSGQIIQMKRTQLEYYCGTWLPHLIPWTVIFCAANSNFQDSKNRQCYSVFIIQPS